MLPAPIIDRRRFGALLAGTAALALMPAAGAAAPTAGETARAINLAGRQRMLSQRMARAATFMRLRIDPSRHAEMLGRSAALFDATLAGLREGSAAEGLAAEDHPRILEALATVGDLWREMRPLATAAAGAGTVDDAALDAIRRLETPLLFTSDNVVDQIVLVRGSRAGSAGLASAINIAGRQRMLSQKMAKEAALVALDRDREANRRALRESVLLFDQSLSVLIGGEDALRLPAAPDRVRPKLLDVRSIWGPYGEIMGAIADGAAVGTAELHTIASQADPLLDTMNEAVNLYEALGLV